MYYTGAQYIWVSIIIHCRCKWALKLSKDDHLNIPVCLVRSKNKYSRMFLSLIRWMSDWSVKRFYQRIGRIAVIELAFLDTISGA